DIGHICTDTSNGQVGIYSKSSNVTIEGNWLHIIGRFSPGENGCQLTTNNYQNHDHGLYFDGQPTGMTIRNNIFQTIKHGWSIQLWNGTISNVDIINNTFFDGNDQYRDGAYFVFWTGSHNKYTIKNNIFGLVRTAVVETQTYNT